MTNPTPMEISKQALAARNAEYDKQREAERTELNDKAQWLGNTLREALVRLYGEEHLGSLEIVSGVREDDTPYAYTHIANVPVTMQSGDSSPVVLYAPFYDMDANGPCNYLSKHIRGLEDLAEAADLRGHARLLIPDQYYWDGDHERFLWVGRAEAYEAELEQQRAQEKAEQAEARAQAAEEAQAKRDKVLLLGAKPASDMTLREYLIGQALAGVAASDPEASNQTLAEYAVEIADMTIAKMNE